MCKSAIHVANKRSNATGFPPLLTERRTFSSKGLLRRLITDEEEREYYIYSHYMTRKHLSLIIFPCLRAEFRAFHPHDVIERDSNKSYVAGIRSFLSSPFAFGTTVEVTSFWSISQTHRLSHARQKERERERKKEKERITINLALRFHAK